MTGAVEPGASETRTCHGDPEPATSRHDGPACAHIFFVGTVESVKNLLHLSGNMLRCHLPQVCTAASALYDVSELRAPKLPYSATISNDCSDASLSNK